MRLDQIIEEPPTSPAASSGGTVTIMIGGKRETLSMDEFRTRMDPKTGNLPRELWMKPDMHLGGVGGE